MSKRLDSSRPTPASLRDGDRSLTAIGQASEPDEGLPFAVELWTLTRESVECVLGRAASAALAQAIFVAAQSEHLGRRITLRRGPAIVSESAP